VVDPITFDFYAIDCYRMLADDRMAENLVKADEARDLALSDAVRSGNRDNGSQVIMTAGVKHVRPRADFRDDRAQ
jgi:hypothetical protein